ncbi:cysteine hydrolase family protein [Salisediminibacterium halotolerans]|uniref:cysteine hydrolase family protein n=1 Tax=Salisediminibacterium halotolerans TaxID=517425 RepID=UPI000EAD4D74|nr:isochorismatase family cysteine hydrolase [Salisediminibacterium halotolerans]RLJ74357.1 nicotinamidase-related amidase [Actinophytocola xinjiangensis]RPE87550.1 nicotinamidase-related amidase [Salisediminibacterium halotolerans]TWG35194.1 nicotinamidase-related amidase [Salisediminibacterium halotolerans]GEL08868.1 putative isochorismatase hydrolase [Salisediminibacterium halotolerans]
MDKTKTAVVLIDMQKESSFGIADVDQVIEKAAHYLPYFREQGIPIIYTRQINRADGTGLSNEEPLNEKGEPIYYHDGTDQIEIFDEIAPQKGEPVIDKYRWSSFHETSLDLMLRSLNVTDVVMAGFVTDGCLMTSVFDAYFRNYKVHLLKDLIATTNEGAHMSAMLIMANWVYDMEVYDTEELVKKMNGETYRSWKGAGADTLQFTPETIREQYNQLKGVEKT